MLSNGLVWLAVVGTCVVLLILLRYGAKAASVAGVALSALWIYLAGRRGQRREIENQVAREELKDEIARNEAAVAAEAAADRVRVGHATDPDSVREHDPFERR